MEPAQDFDHQLRSAADLLAQGEVGQAEQHTDEALRLRPGNALAQNLLGLIRMAQRRFAEACELFELLARRNADVVTLRVNAGLAALGAGEHERAHDQLRRAVDLEPAHRRAFAYLAVIHLHAEQPELARAALVEAGLDTLAARLDVDPAAKALAGVRAAADRMPPGAGCAEPPPRPWDGFAEAVSATAQPLPSRPVSASGEISAGAAGAAASGGAPGSEGGDRLAAGSDTASDPGAQQRDQDAQGVGETSAASEADAEFDDAFSAAFGDAEEEVATARAQPDDELDEAFSAAFGGDAAAAEPVSVAPPEPRAAADSAPAALPLTAEERMARREAALSARAGRASLPGAGAVPRCFEQLPRLARPAQLIDCRTDHCSINLDAGELAAASLRQDLIALSCGSSKRDPVCRRSRGRDHGDNKFIVDGAPFLRVTGGFHVLADEGDAHFEQFELADDSVYFAERVVAGFAAGLRWENGYVPGTDIAAVEFAGRGFVVLHCPRPLQRVELAAGEVVLLRSDCLAGWGGDVVPHIMAASAPLLRLDCGSGGVVVMCLPRRGR